MIEWMLIVFCLVAALAWLVAGRDLIKQTSTVARDCPRSPDEDEEF